MPGPLRRRLAAVLSRPRFERDMREELRSHLEHRIDDLVAAGSTREDAARQAGVEFGALEAYKEECRDTRGFDTARITLGLWADFKLAARRLRATPLFLVFAVLSLAVGLGVTTTAYALLESAFWKPLGISRSEHVAVVTIPGGTQGQVPAHRRRQLRIELAPCLRHNRRFRAVDSDDPTGCTASRRDGHERSNEARGSSQPPGLFGPSLTDV